MKKYTWLFAMLAAVVFTSCLESNDFPPEPQLVFRSYEVFDKDSAVLTLDFTDGDGNFGLRDNDTSGVFCNSCLYSQNVFIEYYEKQSGQWVHYLIDPDNGATFHKRAPFVEPSGQQKAQQGTIKIDFNDAYVEGTGFDTCRFEIFVVDRSLNQSNTVVTQSVIKLE